MAKKYLSNHCIPVMILYSMWFIKSVQTGMSIDLRGWVGKFYARYLWCKIFFFPLFQFETKCLFISSLIMIHQRKIEYRKQIICTNARKNPKDNPQNIYCDLWTDSRSIYCAPRLIFPILKVRHLCPGQCIRHLDAYQWTRKMG